METAMSQLELRNRLPKWRNGRREGLKNLWALARVGSTPTFGTTIELRNRDFSCSGRDEEGMMVPRGGLEPPTHGFSVHCSTS